MRGEQKGVTYQLCNNEHLGVFDIKGLMMGPHRLLGRDGILNLKFKKKLTLEIGIKEIIKTGSAGELC